MNFQNISYDKLTNVMKQYYKIKSLHLDKIVMFQLGDFYEMFFEDALTISYELELTLTSKSAGLEEKIPMCGIPCSAKNDYINKIMKLNHNVVIVDQVETSELGKKLVNREVVKIISPGTYIEDNNIENKFIGSLNNNQNSYELAYGDVATGELFSLEIINFTSVMNELINLQIKEIIVDKTIDEKEIKILEEKLIRIETKIQNESGDLNYQFSIGNKAEKNLLLYLNYTQVGIISHLKEIKKLNINEKMFLSANSQIQLELIKGLSNENETLYSFLNGTATPMGRRYLKQTILHPLIEKRKIEKRQELVSTFYENPINSELIRKNLKNIHDFERLVNKIVAKTVTPKELENLKNSICELPNIYNQLNELKINIDSNSGKTYDTLTDLFLILEKIIVESAPNNTKEGGYIKQGYSEEVDKYRNIRENSDKWLLNFEKEEIEKTGIKKLRIKYNKIFGYFIEVTNSFLSQIPDNYIRKQTMANCERFITPELKNEERTILNSEQLLLSAEYEIITKLREQLTEFVPRLQNVSKLIAKTDLLVGFAFISHQENLVKPKFNQEHKIEIKNAWHPIVNKKIDNFIRNSIFLDETKDVQIITGPNMSGKSTYMRMVGLITIMAQVGCFVPCEECNIKIFDGVYTRIGSGDDISNGLSTFMVEMMETKEALNNCTEDTLLIFDELGRGTSTYDGIAIAKAILLTISKKLKCKTLFSTHYHELIQLNQQENLENVEVVHVKALDEEDGLTFYHKVLPGGSSKSYGIQVAALAGLNSEIIKLSKLEFKKLEEGTTKKVENLVQNEKSKQSETFSSEINEEKNTKYKELQKDLKNINIESLKPIEALNLINSFKEKYEKTEK